MNADWLSRYPKAAAMLQGDDDVLLYEPSHGELPPPPPEPLPGAYHDAGSDAPEEIDRGDW